MALFKTGGLLTGIKGKVGGTVFQGGRSGQQVHNLGRPPRSQSSAASNANANLRSIQGLWGTIPESERVDWRTLASTQTFYNRFGDPYVPTGYQLFLHCKMNLFTLGVSLTSLPPVSFNAFPTISDLFLDLGAGPDYGFASWNYVSGTDDYQFQPYLLGYGTGSNRFIGTTPKYLDNYSVESSGNCGILGFLGSTIANNWVAGNMLFLAYKWISKDNGNSSSLAFLSGTIV